MAFTHVGEVSVVGEMHGQQTYNVYHFGSSGAVPNLAGIVAAILDCFRTHLLPVLSSEWKLLEVRSRVIYPAPTDEVVTQALPTDVGALTQAFPSFVAVVMSLRTGTGGRSFRGRKYLAGIPETRGENSKITAPQLAAIIAFAACMLDKLGKGSVNKTVNADWVVLSRKVAGPGKDYAAGSNSISSVLVREDLGTMRSRKLGRGR